MGFLNKYPYTDFHELNLDWTLKTVKEVMAKIEELEDWKNTFQEEYNEFKKIYDQITAGIFPPEVQNAFTKWMQKNAVNLVGEMVHNVFFGINDAGYFVAYIPESWDDIIFTTSGLDEIIPGLEYGHLILSY